MAAHFSYTLTVQLEYTNHLLQFFKLFPIVLALCLMLSVTYYAQNYICWHNRLVPTYNAKALQTTYCMCDFYITQEIANVISVPIIRLLNSVYSDLFGQIQILRSPRIRFWNNLRCGTNIFRTHPIYRLFLSVDPIKFPNSRQVCREFN